VTLRMLIADGLIPQSISGRNGTPSLLRRRCPLDRSVDGSPSSCVNGTSGGRVHGRRFRDTARSALRRVGRAIPALASHDGQRFRSLTEGLHTDGPMGTAMLTIMAAFAQLERDTMIERTRAGLAAAAANGRKGGRPRKVDDANAAKARQLRAKGITATDIAKMLGVSRATVYRYLAEGAAA
jgi:CRP-like cAMP-binding protein